MTASSAPADLTITALRETYRSGRRTVSELIAGLLDRADRAPERHVWIARLARDEVLRHAAAVERRGIESQPLYGIPFVIKDNIDLAGIPTTAACPQFAYLPDRSATVVAKLLAAGAIPLGKTNLDQFATGLVGTRSPYGACRNSIDGRYVAGGSSAGSAVAVATGLASFALGTDTAGSGRVPAAFNNVVGLKPTFGRLSTIGVVPACRTLDCVSIFALCAADAAAVLDCAEGYDAADVYSRRLEDSRIATLRFGVPLRSQLDFFGDSEYERLFDEAVARFESLGGIRVDIDFSPFLEAASLLYDGPWIAERYAAVGAFMESHPDALLPVTRELIARGRIPPAAAAFEGQYRLMALKRAAESAWSLVDLLFTPTTGTIPTVAAVEADPLRPNFALGRYTNFVNFFDLAAVAVPAGFRGDGLPFGVSLAGPAATERALLNIADPLHRASAAAAGASRTPPPSF